MAEGKAIRVNTYPNFIPRSMVEEHVAPLLRFICDTPRFEAGILGEPHLDNLVEAPIALCSV